MSAAVTVVGGAQVDVVLTPVGALPAPGETLLADAMSFPAAELSD